MKQIGLNPNKNAEDFYEHCKNNGLKEDEVFIKTCWDFVKYQFSGEKICNRSYTIFEQEGFHIGSPWHGDILQAPILFLSINPGVTHKCLFPRWNWKHNTYAFGGEQNGSMNYFITYTKDNGANVQTSNVIHDDREIYEFLTNRFLTACLDHRGTPDEHRDVWYPNAWIIRDDNICTGKETREEGGQRGVPYWQGIRNTMELLLGFKLHSRITKDETRRLMRPVLSTEIISWGSQAGFGADDERLKYFWNRFTVPMLENCGARIIFLSGKDAQNTFYELQTRPVHNRFDERFVVFDVNHFSQGAQNYSEAVSSILEQENNNQVIHNALQEARRIYNQ